MRGVNAEAEDVVAPLDGGLASHDVSKEELADPEEPDVSPGPVGGYHDDG